MHDALGKDHVLIDTPVSEPRPLYSHLHQWMGDYESLDQLHEKIYLFSFWQHPPKTNSYHFSNAHPIQLMFSIENRTLLSQKLALVYPDARLSYIKVQYWVDGAKQTQYETGNQLPFHSRPINHRHFVFPLNITAQQTATVLIEFEGRPDAFLNQLRLWDLDTFYETTDVPLITNAMLLGILLLLLLYHGLIFLTTKEYAQFWFSLFITAFFLRVLTTNNIGFEFLWPNAPFFQNFILVSSVMISSLLTPVFIIYYLQLNKHTPNILLVYKTYIALHFIVMALQTYYGWPVNSVSYWLLIAGPFSLFIIVNCFWLYRHGNTNAGIFLLSYLFLISAGLFTAGNQFFNFNIPFEPSEEIGQLLQILILSLALSMDAGRSREKMHIAYAKNKAKNDFLAKMSHEIRTPINGVLGMAQLLSETPLSRKQQHYADVINHCSKTLLNVINNILEYSKIEAGKIELENTTFNLDDLLLNNNGLFWPQIHNKGLAYKFYFDPTIPRNLQGDPTRLQQVFNNVFSNAIKFTDHGSISLTVTATSIQNGLVNIQFTVSDTGIGIKEDDVEHIFSPFSQANASTTRLYGGSGLGLNITQQLVSLMGGTIALKSTPKLGTVFTVEIPFKIDSYTEYLQQKQSSIFSTKKAFIVSNLDEDTDLVKKAIRFYSIEYNESHNIDDAINVITNNDTEFDLFCIELSLFNSYSTIQKKALHKYGQHILIYDCSFNGSSSDLYLEGFHLLSAPFSFRHLQNQLLDIFDIKESLASTDNAEKNLQHATIPNHLLVAEDDATNRLVIRAILKKMNIKHDIVANGILAMEYYTANPQAYELLLMDCEMPEMNGYDAAAAIREYEQAHGLKAIPIIALTAHVLPEYEKRCYESGMNMVVAKPVDIDILMNAFKQFTQ
jgi:signal transduction histidine kinase/CheY-like chemotaxis protein